MRWFHAFIMYSLYLILSWTYTAYLRPIRFTSDNIDVTMGNLDFTLDNVDFTLDNMNFTFDNMDFTYFIYIRLHKYCLHMIDMDEISIKPYVFLFFVFFWGEGVWRLKASAN